MEMKAREAVQAMIMAQVLAAAREMKRIREAELAQAAAHHQYLMTLQSNARLTRLQKTAQEHGTNSNPESAAATQHHTTGNGFAQLNSQKPKPLTQSKSNTNSQQKHGQPKTHNYTQ